MKISFLIMLAFFLNLKLSAATAIDLGFRYKDGRCLDKDGNEGVNPAYFGQCGDLSGVRLGNFSLDGIDISGSKWKASDLSSVSFKNARIVGVDFSSARISGVDFTDSVIENVDFTDAVFKNITLFDAQLHQLVFKRSNLSGNQLTYAEFKNSIFEDVDFSNTDLADAKFSSSKLIGVNFTRANLEGIVFKESTLEKINFSSTKLMGAEFSSMDLSGYDFSNSNLQSAQFLNSNLTGAQFVQADLSSSALVGSFGENIDFSGAKFLDSDLTKAVYKKSLFRRSNLTRANLANASLLESDIRNAIFENTEFSSLSLTGSKANKRTIVPVSSEQLIQMGVTVDSNPSVLILWDVQNDSLEIFKKSLEAAGIEVTLSESVEYNFLGFKEGAEFDAVIFLDGMTYGQGMQVSGQRALVDYVKNGGAFLHTEWLAYEIEQGTMSEMKDLSVLKRVSAINGPVEYIPVADQAGHPIFTDFDGPKTISNCTHNSGPAQSFATEPARTLAVDKDGLAMIAERNFGKGRVIGFASAGNFDNECLKDKNLQTYFINALMY